MTCVHHWIIDSPAGGTSLGTCKKCGATKEFENAPHLFTYQELRDRMKRGKESPQ